MIRVDRQTQRHGGILYTHLIGLVVLLLYAFPAAVIAQEGVPATQPVPETTEFAPEEYAVLSTAQQEARQLATALIGRADRTRKTPSHASLSISHAPLLKPGTRPVLLRITTSQLEARLVGGRLTLASPVEPAPATTHRSSKRPRLLPEELNAIALEIVTR